MTEQVRGRCEAIQLDQCKGSCNPDSKFTVLLSNVNGGVLKLESYLPRLALFYDYLRDF